MEIAELLIRQNNYFASGATLDVNRRISVLKSLKCAIQEHEQEIFDALHSDLGKSETESYMCEVGLTLNELTCQIRHLRSWSRPRWHRTELANFPAKSFTVRNPYGCVLILSPWNYPFLLTMEPFVGALAAGNCCVLKPSAYSPATSSVIARIVQEIFSPEYVSVVEGGREENQALLEAHFDYIFFTGGVAVGRTVMEKAAAHLTPITLELGGKSPCIVDRTADLSLAAKRIAFGKYINCGQTCVAPDYLLIDRTVKDEFLTLFARAVQEMYGERPLENSDYGKIINQKHFDRLISLMDASKIVFGGDTDSAALRISPTVMDHISADDPVMAEEIFGPILPVLAYDTAAEAEAFIRDRERPLACYLFTRDKNAERRFCNALSFGGGCINDTIIHLATSRMGFGGVGESGMGAYHGRKSFETFTHEKSIVKKSLLLDLPVRYQPYTQKRLSLIRRFLH